MQTNMQYRHLHCFLAVAEELHFTRAAARLGIAQPHVSHEIRRLEKELGVTLFSRNQRRVELTAAGAAFLPKVQDILLATEAAIDAARRTAVGEIGELRIGFAGSTGYDVLPGSIRAFRGQYPEPRLRLLEMTTIDAIRALGEARIDLAFGRTWGDVPAHLELEVVRQDRAMVALPEGHRGATAPTVSLRDLADDPWIVFDRTAGHGLFTWLVLACEAAGFAPRVGQEAGEIPTMINLVASGLGVAAIPEPVSTLQREGVVYRAIDEDAPAIPLAMMWRSDDASPLLHNFLEIVHRICGIS